jgi:Flp pilus assembly protein TadD
MNEGTAQITAGDSAARRPSLGIAQIVAALIIGGLFVIARARPAALWGLHAGGFLDFPLHASVAAAAIVVALVARQIARWLTGLRVSSLWVFPILVALAASFWLLRERFYYLGDAQAMLQFYEFEEVKLDGHAFLTTLINYNLFRWMKSAFGTNAEDVIAATSVAAGVLLVIATLWATRRVAVPPADDGPRTNATSAARALLLTSGAMAIAFGYVENYAFVLPALVLFLGAGVDAAAGRRGLVLPFAALVITMLFHFVGFTMLPAFAYLVWRVSRSDRSGRTTVVGASLLLGLVACVAALGFLSSDPTLHVSNLGRHLLFLPGDPFFRAFPFLSPRHLSEIGNLLLLVIPVGITLLVACLASLSGRRALRDPDTAFLGVASIGALALVVIFNAEIGMARDWDLFAFAALPLALFAGKVLAAAGVTPAGAVVIAAVQAANTIPFVLLNHDSDAALARARAIHSYDAVLSPHAHGYSAVAIAPELSRRGRYAEALAYAEQAVRERPWHVTARVGLAGVLIALGREDEGAAEARRALELEPRDNRALALLATYHARRGEGARAIEYLEESLAVRPDDPRVLGDYGIALSLMGRTAEARAALMTAVAKDPDRVDTRFALAKILVQAGDRAGAVSVLKPLASHPTAGTTARYLISRLE